MSTQREPKGIPIGGQFATSGLDEADFDLAPLTDDEYNQEGSFSFPPPPRNLSQLVRFWRTVPISDSILVRMTEAYERHQFYLRREAVGEFISANPEPPKMSGRKFNPGYQVWLDGQAQAQAEVDSAHPRTIPPHWARGVARATMLTRQAIELDVNTVGPDSDLAYEYQDGAGPNSQRVLRSHIDVGAQGQMSVSYALNMFRTMDLDEDIWYDRQAQDLSVLAQSVTADD